MGNRGINDTQNSMFWDYEKIAKSGLFDAEYYRQNNSDVTNANVDPLMHYLECGAREGRNPSVQFDTSYYLEQCRARGENPENPLLHFLASGDALGLKTRRQEPSILFFLDSPSVLDGKVSTRVQNSLQVSGWAISRCGIASIDISVDGKHAARAYHGVQRKDVADALPNFANALRSGFGTTLSRRVLPPGRHIIALTIRNTVGNENGV